VELAVFSSRAKGIPGKHRLPSRSGTNGKIPNSPLRFLMLAQTSIQTVASADTTAAAWQPDRPESLVQMAPAPDSLIAGRRLTGGLSRARLSALAGTARRHGLSAVGPLGVSGAHFLAALMLLHFLPSAEFGQFSFAIVLSALCMSLTNGLLGAPVSSLVHSDAATTQDELNTYFKFSIALAGVLSVVMFVAMLFSGAAVGASAVFGIYGGAMSLRLFARTYAYSASRVRAVVLSDITYSLLLATGLTALLALHRVGLSAVAIVMAGAAAAAIAPFGRSFLDELVKSISIGSVWAYRKIWKDMTRWSLSGVITTEITINAHAYLVTFISGPKAFALLAVGSLFMRPFSLISSALPDQERPAMARSIAAGDTGRAVRIAHEFLLVIGAIWLATLALSAIVLTWFPSLIIKKGYDKNEVIAVVVMWGLITAVRGIRAPDTVLLQAARAFRPLADASAKSGIAALFATLLLLLLAGPIASLGGILIGDIVMWVMIMIGVRNYNLHRG
jgi:O-antigen/teichoic acid export membrane protein